MNRGLACIALAGLAALPRALGSQTLPEALKESALAVRVSAFVPSAYVVEPQAPGAEPAAPGAAAAQGQSASAAPAAPKGADWQSQHVKYTVPGAPASFKLVGANLAVLVQVTPFIKPDSSGLMLVAQGQVWVKNKEGSISYHTTINTLNVNYGEKVLFLPLGLDAAGKAPLRLEITVLRAADLPSAPDDAADKAGSGDKAAPADKAGPGDKAGK